MSGDTTVVPNDDWYVVYLPGEQIAAVEVGPRHEPSVLFWSARNLAEQFLRENQATGEVRHAFSRTRLGTHGAFAGLVGQWLAAGIRQAVVDLRMFGEPNVLTIALSKFFGLGGARTGDVAPSAN